MALPARIPELDLQEALDPDAVVLVVDSPSDHVIVAGVLEAVARLIREVSPADAVLWRTVSGTEYTAHELLQHIEAGDELGRQYASDLLRISRDFLRRTANRPGQRPPAVQAGGAIPAR